MAEFLIEFFFAFFSAIVGGCLRGVPVLFRRHLPGGLNMVRWIAILSPVVLVVCWYVARWLHQFHQQETLLEVLIGTLGWVMIVTFFVCLWWCGVSVSKGDRKAT